jgi:hypothetical protein
VDGARSRQTRERDRTKRETLLHEIQRLMHERVMYGPIFEPATLHGIGPHVEGKRSSNHTLTRSA